jgi:uncharacterized protein (TIGR02271 family)
MTAGGEHRDDALPPTEALQPTEALPPTEAVETTRHEERMVTGTELHDAGSVRVRKHVATYPVEEVVPRSVEHVDTTGRAPGGEDDDGEVRTLPDGSVSIPVFEEVLVVTKKLVVRERVIVRKHTVVDEHTLQTELRREHVTVDADAAVEDRVTDATQPPPPAPPATHGTTGTTGNP